MLSAITTLAFLGVLWLVGVIAVRTFEESGDRIAAALAGPTRDGETAVIVKLHRQAMPIRSEEPLRAAA